MMTPADPDRTVAMIGGGQMALALAAGFCGPPKSDPWPVCFCHASQMRTSDMVKTTQSRVWL